MINTTPLENILFFDIETVPEQSTFESLSPEMQYLWRDKAQKLKIEEADQKTAYFERAGIFAEFSKVVCISVGFFRSVLGETPKLRIKSFYSHNEVQLLLDFSDMLNGHFGNLGKFRLCGHNIKEFDVPFLCRRMLINSLRLPKLLNIAGAKPWEVPHIDTLQLWKFGDYKSYTSLKLLAAIMGIPTPKDDIEGKDVASVYWQEDNLERIKVYCQKDVVTVARLYQRFQGLEPVGDDDILVVE